MRIIICLALEPSTEAEYSMCVLCRTEDLLAIFFPHLVEDIEYLLPPEETIGLETQESDVSMSSGERSQNAQPVAGPSRLQ